MEDLVANSKGWHEGLSLGDVAEIVSGVTKGRSLEGKETRVLPYLAVANVQDKSLNLAAIKSIEATEDEIRTPANLPIAVEDMVRMLPRLLSSGFSG